MTAPFAFLCAKEFMNFQFTSGTFLADIANYNKYRMRTRESLLKTLLLLSPPWNPLIFASS